MARKPKAESADRTEICKNCKHSLFLRESIECRRYPPQVIYEGSTGFVEHRFPETSADSFCGEFAPILTS